MTATPYNRVNDFTDDESNNTAGRSTVLTAQLDAELDAVETAMDSTQANLDAIQRSDLALLDDVLLGHEFSAAAITILKGLVGNQNAALNWTGVWATATTYALGDLVHDSGNAYVCIVAHPTSSALFATDLASAWWQLFAQQGSATGFPGGQANNLVLVATGASSEAWQTLTAAHAPLHALLASPTFTGTPTLPSGTIVDLANVSSSGDLPVVDGGTGAGTASGARANIAAAGTGVVNTFTSTQIWKKGADLTPSAGVLTLGTDGNSFDVVSGAISSIAGGTAGQWVLLHFDAASAITHHATNLPLPGGVSKTTATGDDLLFHCVDQDSGRGQHGLRQRR
jgi:hypothetical protein